MGPEIIIPIVLLAIIVPAALMWAKRTLRDPVENGSIADDVHAPGERLTSSTLRQLPSPPWRVVYEIADTKLGGIEHVLIGPPGIFALRTSMEPVPDVAPDDPSPAEVAKSAIARGDLDDALRRCALESDRLVWVHWGAHEGGPTAIDTLPSTVAVDGRHLTTWAAGLDDRLTVTQIDLAWQTVTMAIGRPDPLP